MSEEYPYFLRMIFFQPKSLATAFFWIIIFLLLVLPFGITFSPSLPSFQINALKSLMLYGAGHQEPWPLEEVSFSR